MCLSLVPREIEKGMRHKLSPCLNLENVHWGAWEDETRSYFAMNFAKQVSFLFRKNTGERKNVPRHAEELVFILGGHKKEARSSKINRYRFTAELFSLHQ